MFCLCLSWEGFLVWSDKEGFLGCRQVCIKATWFCWLFFSALFALLGCRCLLGQRCIEYFFLMRLCFSRTLFQMGCHMLKIYHLGKWRRRSQRKLLSFVTHMFRKRLLTHSFSFKSQRFLFYFLIYYSQRQKYLYHENIILTTYLSIYSGD